MICGMRMNTLCGSVFSAVMLAVSAEGQGVIPPLKKTVTYSASSTLTPYSGMSFHAINAGDDRLTSWWSPTKTDRTTCWLQVSYSVARPINYIRIHGGSHFPSFKNLGNLYFQNLRIRIANVKFSDRSEELLELRDVDSVQQVVFRPRMTTSVRIYPLRYYQAERWNDPCISHFEAGYID